MTPNQSRRRSFLLPRRADTPLPSASGLSAIAGDFSAIAGGPLLGQATRARNPAWLRITSWHRVSGWLHISGWLYVPAGVTYQPGRLPLIRPTRVCTRVYSPLDRFRSPRKGSHRPTAIVLIGAFTFKRVHQERRCCPDTDFPNQAIPCPTEPTDSESQVPQEPDDSGSQAEHMLGRRVGSPSSPPKKPARLG